MSLNSKDLLLATFLYRYRLSANSPCQHAAFLAKLTAKIFNLESDDMEHRMKKLILALSLVSVSTLVCANTPNSTTHVKKKTVVLRHHVAKKASHHTHKNQTQQPHKHITQRLASNTNYQQTDFPQLQNLLNAHQYQEAFALASKMADENAGLPAFDNLYAQAAMATHHPNEASFAYQRLLITSPSDANLRLAYANCLRKIDAYQQAADEYRHLATSDDVSVRTSARQYLPLALGGELLTGQSWHAYARLVGGFDSNANSAPTLDSVEIDTGELTLGVDQKTKDSWVNEAAIGFGGMIPLSENQKLDLIGNLSERVSYNTHKNDLTLVNIAAAYNFTLHTDYTLTIPLMAQSVFLNGYRLVNILATGSHLTYSYSEDTKFGPYFDYGSINTPNAVDPTTDEIKSDSTMQVYGAMCQHSFSSINLVSVTRLAYTHFIPHTDLALENNQRVEAINQKFMYMKSKKYIPYFEVGYNDGRYAGDMPKYEYIGHRHDHILNITTGMKIKLSKKWTLEPNYIYTHNSSNIPVNNIERHQAMLELTYMTG
jgi:tetratricopeptide (TPR) repeat protein